jgi:hypothetical protein
MVELKGSLSGIGLPAIVQLIGELHHSGRLELTKLADRGELGFDDGRLVSASFADQLGLKALAACSRQLADAEFRFVESRHTGERTIEIGAAELQLYLSQLLRGDAPPEPVSEPPARAAEVVAPGPCPFLGFADDPSRHYSRPTALHRCFATGVAGLVTGQEQRELCLAGRYTTCQRYENAPTSPASAVQPERSPLGEAEQVWPQSTQPAPSRPPAGWPRPRRPQPEPPEPEQVEPDQPRPAPPRPGWPRSGRGQPQPPLQPPAPQPPAARPLPPQSVPPRPGRYTPVNPPASLPEPVPTAEKPPASFPEPSAPSIPPRTPADVPAGVAARLSAAGQMHLAPDSVSDRAADPPDEEDFLDSDEDSDLADAFPSGRSPARRRRVMFLVAAGAVLGILVLAGVLAVVAPALQDGFGQPDTQSFEPVPTAVRALSATSVSTTSVAGARPSAVAAVPSVDAARPIAAPSPGVISTQPAGSPSPVQARPSAAAASPIAGAGPPILEVLFATGPGPAWLDNPPYATWSDGAYRLVARDRGNFVAVGVPLERPIGDVVVSATFRKTGGPPGGGYGLIVRGQSPQPLDGVNQTMNAYVLETGDKGEFGVWRRDADHFVDLVPWMPSSSVRAGGSPNDLMVRAVGSELTFMVNGAEVAKVEDATLGSGGVGVFVGGDNNEVALDHFTVQLPN